LDIELPCRKGIKQYSQQLSNVKIGRSDIPFYPEENIKAAIAIYQLQPCNAA
jgi:hypothetical protein